MPERRHFPRTSTDGLAVRIETPTHITTRHRVLDLSEGGMLVDWLDAAEGQRLRLELIGGGAHCVAWGYVARHEDRACGIAVERWNGPIARLRRFGSSHAAAKTRAEFRVTDWA